MRKTTSGFTIVEILVVIAIIGILATITFMGFGRYQADTRDSARSNQATILAEALEKYYEQNGEYPSCSALTNSNAATVTTSVLPGVQSQTLVTPKAPSGTTNSIQCTDLTNTSQPDFFAYVGDTSSTCTGSGDCLIFQLKYVSESTGQIVTINSRHKTTFAVSGSPLLASTPDGTNGFTQINNSWPSVASSTSYDLQRSTSNDFSTNLITTNTTSTSVSSTGLSYNTLYFFRVRANSATGNGPWSNITTPTTWSLITPVVTAVANTSTTFTSSWPAVSHASSYTAQCSSNGTTLWSSCSGSTASTSYNWGPTGPGNKLYFRTQAVNGGYTSSWSNIASVTSPISSPAAPGISGGMSGGYAVGNASATSCSEGTLMYQMVYNTNDGGWSAAWGTWSTTLPSISVGASQGYKYIFAVSAICRGVSIDSAQSGIPSLVVVDPISQPSAPNYLWPGSYTHGVNQDPIYSGNCPAGTWAVNGTFRDHYVGGASYGPHPWGYVGSPWVSAGYVEYWGQNQCTTNYTTSSMSPESYNYLRVN